MRLARLWGVFKATVASLGALLLIVTVFPPRWYAEWLGADWSDQPGAVLIVLGGDAVDNGLLGLTSYWRSVYAIDGWREGGFRRLILSGSGSITKPMREFLVFEGVPAEAIVTESRSTTTRENALFASQFARQFPGPYVLLTSDYHMRRAMGAFRRAGLEVRPRPFPDALKRMNDWRDRWRVFLDLVQESVKAVYYRARGWT